MVLAFIFMEITDDSYAEFARGLIRQPEVATISGLAECHETCEETPFLPSP